MSRKSCWLNLSCGVVCLVLLGHLKSLQASDNYPADTYNPKPCAKLKNTINYNEPICLEDGTGGFLAYTVDNCVNKFRLTCPEFNEGECMRYGSDNRPCCRLKYKAGYTWMEIYYSMQYKSTDYDGKVNPNDIVEIHRYIKKHADFGDRDQQDFPANVQDPKGERGLMWHYVTNLADDEFYSEDDINVDCMTKATCEVYGLLDYVGRNYPNGFDPDHNKIELNTYEKDNNATVTISFSDDKCIRILLNRKVLGACQIIYYRESVTPLYTTKYPFHEVNFYRGKNTTGKKWEKSLIARYAYYNIEAAEMRDQIFAFRTPKAPETYKERYSSNVVR